MINATTSENIEDVCKTLVWLGEGEVCVSGETYIFKHNQNAKYLAYGLIQGTNGLINILDFLYIKIPFRFLSLISANTSLALYAVVLKTIVH